MVKGTAYQNINYHGKTNTAQFHFSCTPEVRPEVTNLSDNELEIFGVKCALLVSL